MEEVKALDRIQKNFQEVDGFDTQYLQDRYPREVDYVITLYQSNRINESQAYDFLVQLGNDIIPDRLRGL
jgi:hypothetical protein